MDSALNQAQNMVYGFLDSGLSISSNYWLAALIAVLGFILLITLGLTRRHFIHYSIKGAGFGLIMGFILALILEGFLVIGGRTALTEILGWENPPKPVGYVIDRGTERLETVLSDSTVIPDTKANTQGSYDLFIKYYQSLAPEDQEKAKQNICMP